MSSAYLLPQVSRRGHRFTDKFILITVALERLAYYSIVGNISQYLSDKFFWYPENANSFGLITTGVTFGIGLLAGWLSDTLGRRFYHIIGGYVLYLVGLTVITVSTQFANKNYSWSIILGLLVYSLGAGVVRINMSPFGGDQVT